MSNEHTDSYREFRGFGPPGTGKTHWLARQIRRAHSTYGDVDKLLVASFTKTAAREISRRAELKQGPHMGTLHSICFNLMGRPDIAETKPRLWNDWVSERGMPSWAIDQGGVDVDDPEWGVRQSSVGQGLLNEINSLRSRRVPGDMWRQELRGFWGMWCQFKAELSMVDFTDMIEIPTRERIPPPSGVEVGFFDEVQDFTRLELDLVRGWARSMDYIVLVGDDDQCIYSFKGATPDAFLTPELDDEHKTVLKQSRRVPVEVHALADRWIRQIEHREPKEYAPKKESGEVSELKRATWRHPEPMVDDLEDEIAAGRSVMVLASCSYMLRPVVQVLRRRGVPFHNPYRKKRGDWNPLRVGGKNLSAADRLLCWLRASEEVFGDDWRYWTLADLKAWTDHVEAKGLIRRGGKKAIADAARSWPDENSFTMLRPWEVFENDGGAIDEAWRAAMSADLDWIDERLLSSRSKAWSYPLRLAKERGPRTLMEKPLVTVGTIHSVKGGEAQTVYVFPDISPGGMRQWVSRERRDPIVRLFYVAFTRSSDRLVITGRAGRSAVPVSL